MKNCPFIGLAFWSRLALFSIRVSAPTKAVTVTCFQAWPKLTVSPLHANPSVGPASEMSALERLMQSHGFAKELSLFEIKLGFQVAGAKAVDLSYCQDFAQLTEESPSNAITPPTRVASSNTQFS